jgi:hypothetical protein
MIRSLNTQIVLKPQDLLIALKAAVSKDTQFTYASLASQLGISVAQTHAAVKRAEAARLIHAPSREGITVMRSALIEFVIHGVKYCFPPSTGAPTRGMPTAFAGPSLKDLIVQGTQVVPVWPDSNGTVSGYALTPIFPSVPKACASDSILYDVLALIDALRIGAAREREIAIELLRQRLA